MSRNSSSRKLCNIFFPFLSSVSRPHTTICKEIISCNQEFPSPSSCTIFSQSTIFSLYVVGEVVFLRCRSGNKLFHNSYDVFVNLGKIRQQRHQWKYWKIWPEKNKRFMSQSYFSCVLDSHFIFHVYTWWCFFLAHRQNKLNNINWKGNCVSRVQERKVKFATIILNNSQISVTFEGCRYPSSFTAEAINSLCNFHIYFNKEISITQNVTFWFSLRTQKKMICKIFI